MNQSDLLPVTGGAVIDRPLIAFAFLAQATQVQGDLMSGLTPIFKPIVKQRVGKKFDANEFADAVGTIYGIKIHPWAVDDLAKRLERAGLLVRAQVGTEAHEYVYGNVDAVFDEVTEVDIRQVVQRFVAFARPLLERLDAQVDEKTLEEGFFDELTSIDFHSILLKPERKDTKPSTLGMPKGPDEQRHQEELTARARLDVLCAAFIVEAFHTDRALYELVARIATGALLAQVVLNVQDPGKTASLSALHVLLDAPFVMSVLDLSSEESCTYARDLTDALKAHEASVEVFKHSLEEVKDNLKAVINGVSVGLGFGATARRLHAPAFRSYVSGVLQDIESAIGRAGIRVIDAPTRDALFRHFTAEDEQYFYGMLGAFWNPLAQQRDAASIAAVMRLRGGRKTRVSLFNQAHYVFVTENPRVAECSARMVVSRKLSSPDDVPPAITDRFLAGLIWVLYGGKAVELTRSRLIASCTAALEVRNDVMAKMNRFLKGVDETKATQFRAMMTDERAGQHLMQLTLGDSILITSTQDAEQILDQLESRLEAKHRAVAEKKITEAQAEAAERIQQAQREQEQQSQIALAASLKETRIRSELDAERLQTEFDRGRWEQRAKEQAQANKRSAEELHQKYLTERNARIEEKRPLIQRCVARARTTARRWTCLIAASVGLLIFISAYLGTEFMTSVDRRFSVVGAVLAALIGIVSFWNNPQVLFGILVRKVRDRRFAHLVDEYQLGSYLSGFTINWEEGVIARASEGHAGLNEASQQLTTDVVDGHRL